MPSPWLFTLMALAAFRVTRLIGWDDLTAGWRSTYGGMSDVEYRQWNDKLQRVVESGYDPWTQTWSGPTGTITGLPFKPWQWYLAKLVRCPWCLGFWVSLATAIIYGSVGGGTIAAIPLVALALSAAVGFTAKLLDA